MKDEFRKYLDKKFAGYKKSKALNDFKEEVFLDLCERYDDFKKQGLSDKESFDKSIELMGDYSDALKTIDANTPKPTIITYSKLLVSASLLYFTVLVIAYIGVSFIIDSFKSTWLILLIGGSVYVVFMLFLSSKNAYANKNNARMRFNMSIIFLAVTLLIYFSVSFLTEDWARTWLIIVDLFACWMTADALMSKIKYKNMPIPFRTGVNVMLWTTAIYLTFSILASGVLPGVWKYSWLIVLLGVAVNGAIAVARYYKRYLGETKSDGTKGGV
ncbi:MAG: hypothetical protein LBQ40_05840 [Clostridiales bacterium]|jgi:hypothetical protein|nr:hypothetical protein [Clostridiales bacterium]